MPGRWVSCIPRPRRPIEFHSPLPADFEALLALARRSPESSPISGSSPASPVPCPHVPFLARSATSLPRVPLTVPGSDADRVRIIAWQSRLRCLYSATDLSSTDVMHATFVRSVAVQYYTQYLHHRRRDENSSTARPVAVCCRLPCAHSPLDVGLADCGGVRAGCVRRGEREGIHAAVRRPVRGESEFGVLPYRSSPRRRVSYSNSTSS